MSKWTDVCLHERDYHMVTRRCELPTGHDGLHKSRSSAANVEWVDRNDCNEDCRGCWLWGKARGHHERQRRCPYCYVRGGHEAECRYAAGVVPLAGDDLNAEAEALAQELRERVATMQHALSGGSLVDLRTSAVLVAISADRAAAALLRTVAAPSVEQITAEEEPLGVALKAEWDRVTAYWPPEWIQSPDHIEAEMKSWKDRRFFEEERLILVVTGEIMEALGRSGMTRAALAKRLGVSAAAVSQFLSGTRNMTLRTVAAAALAVGCRMDVKLEQLEVVGQYE